MLRKCLGLAVVAAVLGGVAVATGAIPGQSGTINGCVKNGVLRVIDAEAGDTCKASETAISWNQKGQPGPTGPTGPTGQRGLQGPKGDPCLASDPACVGPPGPEGKIGATGPTGADGVDGAQQVYFEGVNPEGGFPGGENGTYYTFIEKELPPGNYVLEGRISAYLFYGDGLLAHCGLIGDPVNQPGTRFFLSGNETRDLEMTYALKDFPGGPVRVRCHVSGGSLGLQQVTLLATRVASVG